MSRRGDLSPLAAVQAAYLFSTLGFRPYGGSPSRPAPSQPPRTKFSKGTQNSPEAAYFVQSFHLSSTSGHAYNRGQMAPQTAPQFESIDALWRIRFFPGTAAPNTAALAASRAPDQGLFLFDVDARVRTAARKWNRTLPPIPRRDSGSRPLGLFHIPRPAGTPDYCSVRPVGCCCDTTNARSYDY